MKGCRNDNGRQSPAVRHSHVSPIVGASRLELPARTTRTKPALLASPDALKDALARFRHLGSLREQALEHAALTGTSIAAMLLDVVRAGRAQFARAGRAACRRLPAGRLSLGRPARLSLRSQEGPAGVRELGILR